MTHKTKFPTNAQDAIDRAQQANIAASKAREARTFRDLTRDKLKQWNDHFSDSGIYWKSILAFLAAVTELFFSFPLYGDLMVTVSKKGSFGLSLLMGSVIVLFAAFVSALLAKTLSKSIFDFSVDNRMRAMDYTTPRVAEVERIRNIARRELIWGIFFAMLLLYGVGAMSWQRINLVTVITGGHFGFTQRIIPVICVAIEIIAGIFFEYLQKRLKLTARASRANRNYEKYKSICVYETRMTYEFNRKAGDGGEHLVNSQDMRDATYRFERRSQENYVDEIPVRKFLKMLVTEEMRPVEGVLLQGMLKTGVIFSSIYSDPFGEATFIWESEEDVVLNILAGGDIFSGPFQANSTIHIPLKTIKKIKVVA